MPKVAMNSDSDDEIRCNITQCRRIAVSVCLYCHIDLCLNHKDCPECTLRYQEFHRKLLKYRKKYPYSSFLIEQPCVSDMTLSDLFYYGLYGFWVIFLCYALIVYPTTGDGLFTAALVILVSKLVTFVGGELIYLKLTPFDDFVG